MQDPFILTLLALEALIILLSLYAAESKNLAYSILSLLAVSVVAAVIFFMLGGIFPAVVQIAVFSGAVIIMFIFVFIMTRGGVPVDAKD